MRRTELLQEIRKMRFEEAYLGWTEGRLLQDEAARLLGVSGRLHMTPVGATARILQSRADTLVGGMKQQLR